MSSNYKTKIKMAAIDYDVRKIKMFATDYDVTKIKMPVIDYDVIIDLILINPN